MNGLHSTFVILVLALLALGPVGAALAAPGPPAESPLLESPLHLGLPAGDRQDDWRSRAAAAIQADRQGPEPSRLSIVALPPEGVPGTPGAQRVRHALSVRSEAPRRMLRSIGLEASDCATRFRVPTKLRQGSGGVDVSVRAQIGLACRF